MIKNGNNEQLGKKEIDSRYYYFYQIWTELIDYRTLDTYQYRSMNTLNAIKELIEVIDQRLNGVHKTDHNVEECRLETISIVRKDNVLKKNEPVIYGRILTNLSSKIGTDNTLKIMRRKLVYYYELIQQQYLDNVFTYLEKNILNGDKEAIKDNSNQIISCCVSEGWSDRALRGNIDLLKGSVYTPRKWQEFKKRILNCQKSEYCIAIPETAVVRTPNVLISKELEDLGLQTLNAQDLCKDYPILSGTEINELRKYVVINVNAYDYYSASHVALTKYAHAHNMLSFYSVIEAWTVNNIRWIAINKRRGTLKQMGPRDLYSTYNYLEGAKGLYSYSKEINTVPGATEAGSVKNMLGATYRYANMGKASYTQEEKFFNLWVALEALCRNDAYDNIIGNILEIVPPALCQRYIFRLVRNYYEDCLRCEVQLQFSDGKIIYQNQKKKRIVEELISVLKSPVYFQELEAKCKVNDLLLQRTTDMHDLLTDKKALKVAIETHNKNVKYQLSRLYRLRNKIAHSAYSDDNSIIKYVEHLESYLAEVVAVILLFVTNSEETEMSTIFEMIKDNYAAFIEIISNKESITGEDDLLQSFYKTGVITMFL